MALRIRGKRVAAEEVEFGVRFEDGFVLACTDEEDARTVRAMTGGELLIRDVYISVWAALADEEEAAA